MESIIGFLVLAVILAFLFKSADSNSGSSSRSKANQPSNTVPDLKITVSYENSSGWHETKPDDYEWIPPGQPFKIDRYTIPDGMVYCGKYLKSASDDYTIEPSFIMRFHHPAELRI